MRIPLEKEQIEKLKKRHEKMILARIQRQNEEKNQFLEILEKELNKDEKI